METDNLKLDDGLKKKIVAYALEQAEKDRFDGEGNEIYKINTLQLLLCNESKPIGRYKTSALKVFVSDISNRFYSLMDERPNYQHFEYFSHHVRHNGKVFQFNMGFRE